MRIFLREVKAEDGKNIVKWRNSINVARHCIDKTIISEESNKKFFEDMVLTGKCKQFIVEKIDEEYGGVFSYQIGTIYFKDIDKENRKVELGMFPSDEEEWNSIGQELAIKQMTSIAFDELGMHKIYSYVLADCPEEVELFKKCGFLEEGVFRDEIIENDNFRDIVKFSFIQ